MSEPNALKTHRSFFNQTRFYSILSNLALPIAKYCMANNSTVSPKYRVLYISFCVLPVIWKYPSISYLFFYGKRIGRESQSEEKYNELFHDMFAVCMSRWISEKTTTTAISASTTIIYLRSLHSTLLPWMSQAHHHRFVLHECVYACVFMYKILYTHTRNLISLFCLPFLSPTMYFSIK